MRFVFNIVRNRKEVKVKNKNSAGSIHGCRCVGDLAGGGVLHCRRNVLLNYLSEQVCQAVSPASTGKKKTVILGDRLEGLRPGIFILVIKKTQLKIP